MLEIVIGYNAKNRLLFHAPAKENTIIRIKYKDSLQKTLADCPFLCYSYTVDKKHVCGFYGKVPVKQVFREA